MNRREAFKAAILSAIGSVVCGKREVIRAADINRARRLMKPVGRIVVAGENLEGGDMVYVSKDDGKAYRCRQR